MKLSSKILPIFLISILISGCGRLYFVEPEELPTYTEPRYDNNEPIQLKVSKVEVISEFTPSFTRPNVEHLFPVSIEKTAKLWARDRLKAVDFSAERRPSDSRPDGPVRIVDFPSYQLHHDYL